MTYMQLFFHKIKSSVSYLYIFNFFSIVNTPFFQKYLAMDIFRRLKVYLATTYKIFRKFSLLKTYHFHLKFLKKGLFEEAFAEISTHSKKFEILEIGIGSGRNFKNFPKDSNITILDYTDQYLDKLEKSIVAYKRHDLKISKLEKVFKFSLNTNPLPTGGMVSVINVLQNKIIFQYL